MDEAHKTITITNSSAIAAKVTQCLQALSPPNDQAHSEACGSAAASERPTISLVCSSPSAASKLISIAEIVKRRLEQQAAEARTQPVASGGGGGGGDDAKKKDVAGSSWWQYTKLSSVMVPWPSSQGPAHNREQHHDSRVLKKQKAEGSSHDAGTADGDEEFSFLEPQASSESSRQKIRALPTLTIYISTKPIKELANMYGEQKG